MPEATGSQTTDEKTQNTQASGQGGAGDQGAAAQGGQTQENAQDKKLAAEAAKYRVQLRAAEKERDEVKARLSELEAKESASQGGVHDASEIARLSREVGTLQKTVKDAQDRATKAEEGRRQEKLDNALLKAVSDGKLLNPEDAVIIIRSKGRARVADDGKAVFVINENGEEREVVISAEAIKQNKLVPDNFYPADGVGGAGSRGGARASGANGLDYERGLRDPEYFAAHEKEMTTEARRRAQG